MQASAIFRSSPQVEQMLNRRAYRRTRVQRRVEIEPIETGRRSRGLFAGRRNEPTVGRMIDIGCGGMAAEVPLKIDVGTRVDIHIEGIDGNGSQRARGTVRNVRGANGTRTLGIAFTEPILALGDLTQEAEPIAAEGGEPFALVVDDDQGVRQVLGRFLERRGLRVMAVASAEEALELLRTKEPSLMLLDLKMDGMTGVQLLETMNAEGLRVPHVWAMSGLAADEEALAALSLGAGEFINKPFDLDHLDFSLSLLTPIL